MGKVWINYYQAVGMCLMCGIPVFSRYDNSVAVFMQYLYVAPHLEESLQSSHIHDHRIVPSSSASAFNLPCIRQSRITPNMKSMKDRFIVSVHYLFTLAGLFGLVMFLCVLCLSQVVVLQCFYWVWLTLLTFISQLTSSSSRSLEVHCK